MQSILIISKHPESREEKAMLLCHEEGIDPFDITIIELPEQSEKPGEGKRKASIGIEDIKSMQKTLFLKPFRGEKKAVIIHDAHLLTTEAQNALLKTLEEPPPATAILLTAETEEALLPTVRSRCRIIAIGQEHLEVTMEEKKELSTFILSIDEWSVGDALKAAERLAKNKGESLVTLEKMILIFRELLLSDMEKNNSRTITHTNRLKRLQKLHLTIKTTNVNLRLALENFFLT